jgi:hypothetical protein
VFDLAKTLVERVYRAVLSERATARSEDDGLPKLLKTSDAAGSGPAEVCS